MRDMEDIVDYTMERVLPWFIAVLFAVVVAMLLVLLSPANNHIEWIGEQERIAALRRDAAAVGCIASEDVFGQVVEVNKDLASARRWNRIPIAEWYIPDAKAETPSIDVRRCQ